jgi:hypothetical protein
MAVRQKKDVEAALKKKGFRQDEGDHHWVSAMRTTGQDVSVRADCRSFH